VFDFTGLANESGEIKEGSALVKPEAKDGNTVAMANHNKRKSTTGKTRGASLGFRTQ
jgi:hypothetical protein